MTAADAKKQFYFELRSASKIMRAKARSNDEVWSHLERAHILGQSSASLHTMTHALMLMFAIINFDLRESFGQIFRVLLAAPSSWFGVAPPGNSGRAKVGLFLSQPIPDDLKVLLEKKQ